ncbi:MAG: FAD-dependent oxidoreductase [Devosia sp.]
MSSNVPGPRQVDVAIVGGGVAGLYAGWSLRTRSSGLGPSGEAPSVAVFEAGERLGGRLYSRVPPHAPHLMCELGGMRFIDTQDLVVDLIRELGLSSHVFPVGDENNLHLLRGVRFALADLLGGQHAIPYDVAPSEARQTPSQLLAGVLRQFLPDGASLDDEQKVETERSMTFNGKPVTEVSAIEVLRSLLSPAAYEFILEGMGYTCILDEEIGAANLIHTDLRGGTWRTLDKGMQALPLQLGERFEAAGGNIHTQHRLMRVDKDGERYSLILETSEGTQSVQAKRVILALPAAALKALDKGSVMFDMPHFAGDLDSVVPVPASKLYFGFPSPWWEDIGLREGRSVTDLPVRQCLYFGVENERGGTDPQNTSALLVASYSDGNATRYWESLVGEPPFHPTPEGFGDGLAVSSRVVEDVRGQLSKLHGIDVPMPEWAAFIDWTLPPFGGGWHYWRVGHRSFDVVPRLRKPGAGDEIYVCGEAFSSHQAWILGALSSTERVLQDHLGLAAPTWLREGADLGA